MKLKKLCAMLSAFAVSVGALAYYPNLGGYLNTNALVISNDFEINYDGWVPCGNKTILKAESYITHDSERSMLVSNRQTSQDGAVSQKGLYLDGGVSYDYSIYVYHNTEQIETFQFVVSYNRAGSDAIERMEIDTQSVSSGEWVQLSGRVKTPKDAENITVKISMDSTSDFYFDDFEVTGKNNTNVAYATNSNVGLKDQYANYFRVGSVLNSATVQDSTITATILKEFNSITFENEMKPDYIMDKDNSTNTNIAVSLNACASLINFCAENNIGVRGHTLVWHSQTPEWVFKENLDSNGAWVSEDLMNQRLESYIKNVFSAIEEQYPSLNLYAYDVCNECISDDTERTANYGGSREPGYGNGKSPWVQVYGDNSFVEKAFTYAKEYAPSTCALFYNDYNEYWDHKRDAIYNMCKPLYDKGVLDGIAMQSHIGSEMEGFTGVSVYTEALQKYSSIGCQVQISELDISTDNGSYTEYQQSEKYKAIFQAAVDVNKSSIGGKVTAVCVWGPNDANTWIGSENTPLLFDVNNQPKGAYYAVADIIPEDEWGDGNNPNISSGNNNNNDDNVEPNEYGWYFDSSFENDTEDWSERGNVTIEKTNKTAYVGENSLYVSGRTNSWNGVQKTLNSNAFKAGEEYSFSANVKYTDGNITDTFFMKLQYVDANGDTQYSTIAEATAIKGEWVQLANTNYQIPSDATDMKIYIETADSTNSFYVDEVIGAVGGTTILGAGNKKFTLGDLNSDGKINVTDYTMAKNGVLYGFDDSIVKLSADVDQSGIVDATDIKLLKEYIFGIINEFPISENPVEEPVEIDPTTFMNNVRESLSEYAKDGITDALTGVDYGNLQKYTYYSTTRERVTNVNVLLPPGYSQDEKYPVLYALHGYWENEDSLVNMSQAQNMLGNLIASGEAEKMIIVFPYTYTSKTQEACSALDLANSLNYDNFINDLTTDLMPYIESTFSVKTGRENTAITGFSMGGRESLFIGCTRSDLFGYIGAVCPAPGLTPGTDLSSHPGQLQESELNTGAYKPYLMLLTGGDNDIVVFNQPSLYHNILTTNGVDHVWHTVSTGQHNDTSVQPHMYNYLRNLFKATK